MKYYIGALTMALLVCPDNVNGVSIKSQTKSTTTLQAKTEAKAELKAKVETKAKVEEKDYFMEPFTIALSQTQNLGGFDIPPIISNTGDHVKTISDKIPEPVKETVKDIAVDHAHSKAAGKLDTADKIVNSPYTSSAAGKISPDLQKAVEDFGDKIKEKQKDKNVVGNHTKNLISKLEDSLDYLNTQSLLNENENETQPPIVSAIQAIDQYGNVLASAQNPKAFSMLNQLVPKQQATQDTIVTKTPEPALAVAATVKTDQVKEPTVQQSAPKPQEIKKEIQQMKINRLEEAVTKDEKQEPQQKQEMEPVQTQQLTQSVMPNLPMPTPLGQMQYPHQTMNQMTPQSQYYQFPQMQQQMMPGYGGVNNGMYYNPYQQQMMQMQYMQQMQLMQQQQMAAAQYSQQKAQQSPSESQLVQQKQDVHQGGVPTEILALEQKQPQQQMPQPPTSFSPYSSSQGMVQYPYQAFGSQIGWGMLH